MHPNGSGSPSADVGDFCVRVVIPRATTTLTQKSTALELDFVQYATR